MRCQWHATRETPCMSPSPVPFREMPPFLCTRAQGHDGPCVACMGIAEGKPESECVAALWETMPDGRVIMGVRQMSEDELARGEAIAYDALPESRRRLLN